MMNSPALQPGFKTFGKRHYDALGILRYFRKSLFAWECVVGLGGLELPTKRLSAARAKRLNYGLAH
jgi:hypothetical protein